MVCRVLQISSMFSVSACKFAEWNVDGLCATSQKHEQLKHLESPNTFQI
jgi:hypothetical protein